MTFFKSSLFALLIICSTAFPNQIEAILLNAIMTSAEARSLWPYETASTILKQNGVNVIPVDDKVIFFALPEVEKINTLKLGGRKKSHLKPLDVRQTKKGLYAVVYDPLIGRSKLGLFSIVTGKPEQIIEHHSGHPYYRINLIRNASDILVSGVYLTRYSYMLDTHDENVFSPSDGSINKFKNYFLENTAYSLCVYDSNLHIVDSMSFLTARGETLVKNLNLKGSNPTDIGEDGMIYSSSSSTTYSVKIFDEFYKFISEHVIDNSDYKPLPKDLNDSLAEELKSKANSFSTVYAMYSAGNFTVTGFYPNAGGRSRPEGPFFYDVLDGRGTVVSTGQLPAPIFCRDTNRTLYLYVEVEGTSMFGDDKYFLCPFEVSDLIAGSVNEDFIRRATVRR